MSHSLFDREASCLVARIAWLTRVAVTDDATASPTPHHDYGMTRVRGAGAVITSVKGIYYEWVRDLATTHRIRPQLGESLPAGVTL